SALPLVLAAYLILRAGWSWAPLALIAAAAVTVAPWVVRNRAELGCYALTTDGRALWKANNLQTYPLLTHGKWIDDVKDPPGHPFPNPEEARVLYQRGQGTHHIDECANQSYYQHKAWVFVREHPGAKAKLAGLTVRMEWDPRTTASATDSGHGVLRTWAQPLYTSLLYVLAIAGLVFVPRRFAALVLVLLAYQTVAYDRLSAPRDVDPALAWRVARAARGAELVHTHLVHADVYGALGARRLVSTKHNDDPFRAGAFRFVERTLAHRAGSVIAITH